MTAPPSLFASRNPQPPSMVGGDLQVKVAQPTELKKPQSLRTHTDKNTIIREAISFKTHSLPLAHFVRQVGFISVLSILSLHPSAVQQGLEQESAFPPCRPSHAPLHTKPNYEAHLQN